MKQLFLALAIILSPIALNAQILSQQISYLEYYIDDDPGVGNGIPIPVIPNVSIDETIQITVGAHGSNQFHKLYVRARDTNNSWSLIQHDEFYISAPLPEKIVQVQYFFDEDPGVGVPGNGAIIPVTPVSNLEQTQVVTIPGPFTSNYRSIFIRTQNESGVWSLAEKRLFAIGECVDISADDIISWWSFDELSENIVEDIVGDHDGVLINDARVQLIAPLDGVDDYIGVPDSDDWAFGTEDFTIEFFANLLSPGGDLFHPYDKFIGQSEGGGNSKKWTFALNAGTLFFRISDGSTYQNLVQYPFAPDPNLWYHLALTRQVDTLKTYINGELAGYEIVPGLSIPNVNSALTIGSVNWAQGPPRYLNGKLDEMTIYKRALTPQEIITISNAEAGGKCKNLQIKTTGIADVLYGAQFSQLLEAQFGTEPYTWSLSGGDLAEGITLSSGGILGGMPTVAGDFDFTVQVTDANNNTAQKDFALRVNLTTLPNDNDLKIFKSGTSAVPGREVDYFIYVENIGNVNSDSISINEYLDPWYTYVTSEPASSILENTQSIFSGQSIPSVIQWQLSPLSIGASQILHYQVKLEPTFPAGHTVYGSAIEDFLCSYECYAEFENCMQHLTNDECDIEDPGYDIDECLPLAEGCVFILQACLRPCGATTASGVSQIPVDPNEKMVLAKKYVQPDALLPYVIHFENIGTIEARDVFITDTLDEDLDEATLNIISSEGATFNPATRVLKWELYNINLLPDSGAYVMYTANPKPNLPSGTVIHNTGHIQFEIFDIFSTNETENIIDYTDPEGIMDALPATIYQTAFPIYWSGMDAVGEIKNYTIFVSKNGGSYEVILSQTEDTSIIFTGETGNTYSFICVAEDLAGNVEVQNPIAEASTYIDVLCTDVYYFDADQDGFGNIDLPSMACVQPAGFVNDFSDCNDQVSSINPGVMEVCNSIDDDCDGQVDDGLILTLYQDADADGFGNPAIHLNTCEELFGFIANGNDCDDANSDINPNAPEMADGEDNDCDGLVDESTSDLSVDAGDCAIVYLGYEPAECIELAVNVEGGSAPYFYFWSNGAATNSIELCPEETSIYTITVTDNNGFSAQDVVTIHVIDIRCGNNNDKVLVCHGTTENSICISSSAVQEHLDHGDYLGICDAADPCDEESQQIRVNKSNPSPELSGYSLTTHAEWFEQERAFSIRPNPANNHLEILTSLIEGRVSLMDMSGKILLQHNLSGVKHTIDISEIPNGIYVIRLENDAQCHNQHLVVMH